jgi:hypothetical protein
MIVPPIVRRCAVDGCDRPMKHLEWCGAHYERWRRHGDLNEAVPIRPKGVALGILHQIVLPYQGDDCLQWPLKGRVFGYPKIAFEGQDRLVSRVVCEITHGPAPSPIHEAAHSCGNGAKGCISPKHIRWATPVENEADKVAHGTAPKGERNAQSKLREPDVVAIRRIGKSASQAAIARRFGVSPGLVSRILSRRLWSHLSEAENA